MYISNLVANFQIGRHLSGNGKKRELTKGSRDNATLVQPAVRQIDHQFDYACCVVATLHFWAALWQDTHRLRSHRLRYYPYISNYAAQN